MKNKWFRNVLLITVLVLLTVLPLEAFAAKKLVEAGDNEAISLDKNTGMMLRAVHGNDDSLTWELMDSQLNIVKQLEYNDMYLMFHGICPFIEISHRNQYTFPCGLLNLQGEEIVPPVYDNVLALSERWQIGVMNEDATEDDYDVWYIDYDYVTGQEGETHYKKAKSGDVFFDGKKIGTLDSSFRIAYFYTQAYGAYLVTQDRDGKIVGIDSSFRIARKQTDSYGYVSEFYTEYSDGITRVYHSGSGQQAFIPGCTLKPEDLCNPYYYQNGCIYDVGGNIIGRTSREYSWVQEFKNGYATACFDEKYGIIDVNGNDVIPPAFDYSLANSGDDEPCYGYFSLVKDGRIGFVDLAGNMTCDFKYPRDQAELKTPFLFIQGNNGEITVVSAAVGEFPERYSDVDRYGSGSEEALVLTDLSGKKGIVNLYGETIFPFSDQYDYIQVTRDGTLAVATDISTSRDIVFSLTENDPEPTEPDIPSFPDEPDLPTVPDEPDLPTVPDEPDLPTVPDEPDLPTVPDEPILPETPVTTEEPVITEQPAPGDEFAIHFCPSCGYKFTLPPIRFCPSCGMDLSPYLQ